MSLQMFQIASFKIICTDSIKILFSKLRFAGLNYHLPKRKFFIFPYCAGVFNQHCLLTFSTRSIGVKVQVFGILGEIMITFF